MDEERKFFSFCSETLKKYDNLRGRFQQISSNYKRPPDNYNPLKYVRGSKLMEEGFINSNFPELDFSKDLKEWNDKEKDGKKKGVLTYEEYLKKAKDQRAQGKPICDSKLAASDISKDQNLQRSSSNKFSYEEYKKQKGLNVNAPNQPPMSSSPSVNFNANPKNDLDFNNINNNFSFNNNKLNPLNFNSEPQNLAPAESNPYENISLDNLNLNTNNYNNQAMNYNMNNYHNATNNIGGHSNYGFGGHSTFPMGNNNNLNQGFPQNNLGNTYDHNRNNKSNLNNDFFDINNLSFPK